MKQIKKIKETGETLVYYFEWVEESSSAVKKKGVQSSSDSLISGVEVNASIPSDETQHLLSTQANTNRLVEATVQNTEYSKQQLASQGYVLSNIWHVQDVLQNYEELTVEQAEEVLENALNNERVMERIFEQIDIEVELIKKDKQDV